MFRTLVTHRRTVGIALVLAAVAVVSGLFGPQLGLGAQDLLWAAPALGITAGSAKHLQTLMARRGAVLAEMEAITTAAAARADGTLTAEERTAFDAHGATIAQLDGDIGRLQAQLEATRGGVEIKGAIQVTDNRDNDPRRGFTSFGEFAQAVRAAAVHGINTADQRLHIDAAAASTYANEGAGADGGFLVPPAFSDQIMTASYNTVDALLPMTDNIPIGGNSMAFPVDETTPWGSSGVKAYWTNEAATSTQSKGAMDPAVMRLGKLTCLVPVTEELQADAPGLNAWLLGRVPEAITWKTNEALWNGDGITKPRGFMLSGARVTQSKESGQSAGTVLGDNVSKMRSRMSAASWKRAVWMINNDVLPQLDKLAYGTTATNAQIYRPEGGDYGYGTLLGRPVMVTSHNESIGTLGDIALVDWKMYRTITAAQGLQSASSMHFWFDQGLTAFRTIFRVSGQSTVTKPVTPNKGSNTLSPLVVLEAR